jgi:hypothetical protein
LLPLINSLRDELQRAEDGLNILLHCLLVDTLGYSKIDIVVILPIVQDSNSSKVTLNIIISVGSILFHPPIIANGWFGVRGRNALDVWECL